MSDIKFKLDINGLRELMKSADMRQALNDVAVNVQSKAHMISGGEPFEHRIGIGSFTAIATVFPDSEAADKSVYKSNVLEKSLDGLPRSKK